MMKFKSLELTEIANSILNKIRSDKTYWEGVLKFDSVQSDDVLQTNPQQNISEGKQNKKHKK